MDVTAIFEQEFDRLRTAGIGQFLTVIKQAEFLGLQQSYLSRIRAGSRSLTKSKALEIAKCLRKNRPSEEIYELRDRLLAAQRPPTRFENELAEWFEEKATKEAIMFVEFREPPVVGPQGERPDLARIVGRAVANGLNYAMLLPIHQPKDYEKIPDALIAYLSSLREDVDEAYQYILEEALEEETEKIISLRATGDKVLNANERLENVASRLRLFRLGIGEESPCIALASRLFYTEYPHRTDGGQSAEPTVGQLWTWVSSKQGEKTIHQILHKDASIAMIRATTVRYFPMLDYWRDLGGLPQNQSEISAFVKKVDYIARLKAPADELAKRWELVPQPKSIIEKAKTFLSQN